MFGRLALIVLIFLSGCGREEKVNLPPPAAPPPTTPSAALRSLADLRAAVERAGKDPLLLLVNHRGTTIFVAIRPR